MATQTGAGPRPRKGFALPVVIVIAFVLGGILFALDRVVTGFRNRSTRFRDGEMAFYAARGGLRIGERILEQLAHGRPREAGEMRDLYDLIVRSRPADLDGGEDAFTVPFQDRLLPGDVDGEVTLAVRFRDLRPVLQALPPGFQADPAEKRGTLELESRARVRGTVRRFLLRRDFVSEYMLPPLLGRFSLLLGEQVGGSDFVNALTYSPRLGLFMGSVSRAVGWPLQVYSLPPSQLAQPPPPATRFAAEPLAPARRGGWVGLFGENPWVLNLTFGAGDGSPLEEGRLIRNFSGVQAATGSSGIYLKTRRIGFARDILELPMFVEVERGQIPDGSSLLHLSGDAREPSPPVVLGRAYRRYLSYSKVGTDPAGPFTSLHAVPSDRFDEVRAVFQGVVSGADYSAYRGWMARHVVEPYNRTYDFVVTDGEVRDDVGRVVPGDTPFHPERYLLASDLRPYLAPAAGSPDDFMYPDPGRQGETRAGGAVAIGDADGTVLYSGSPEDILPGLAEMLPARAVVAYEAGGDREAGDLFESAHLRDGKLDLGTVVHVRSDRLAVGPFHVERGGTLVVSGEVQVSGPITTAPGETLAIVSLDGDVQILDENPIAAIVAALKGAVRPPARGLDIRGAMASARFDALDWVDGKGARRVIYDPRLNPADPAQRGAQYRFYLGGDRRMVVRRE